MNLETGRIYSGFKLCEEREIKEVASRGFLFEHLRSGARLLYLHNDDDNKVFSITFRTPPVDDTGVAHIVEHSVLCGSRKFPLKEPFVELVKGSLNTYLNAMTFPDKTMYPVASRNDKDFQNLIDVYLDAVFYPAMYNCPEIFMQEGWHYEADAATGELSYKGVVYNEMKGALSSPEALLDKEIMASLFPDNTYGCESGGDPDHIPELTYEMFLDFHRRYYHPSNSYIYLYGAMDIEAKLEFLDREYLSAFDRIVVDSAIEEQPLFTEPHLVVKPYPVSANEQTAEKSFLSLNAIVGSYADSEEMLAMQVAEHFLLRTPAAPLKKALIDARIGKDILSSFTDSMLQPAFSIIATGSEPDKLEEFKTVTRETLTRLTTDGIDKKLIEASLNLLEFRLREADYGNNPKGLIYNIKLMDSWLYGGSPYAYLQYEAALNKIKAGLHSDYFERLIERKFLQNNHVTAVVLKPDTQFSERRQREINAQLAAHRAGLSESEFAGYVQKTGELLARQESEDSPEALAAIPLLALDDIEKKSERLILNMEQIDGTEILLHPLTTNKISYLNLYFDLSALPAADVPYAYLLAELLGKVSTERRTYEDLANEINISTGGIAYDVMAFTMNGDADGYKPKFKVKSKALTAKLPKLCQLLAEIITGSDFSDEKRLRELLEQTKAALETYVMRNAQLVSAGRVLAGFSPAGWYNEQGILSFYEFITAAVKDFASNAAAVSEKLAAVSRTIFNKSSLVVSYTADDGDQAAFTGICRELLAALPQGGEPSEPPRLVRDCRREGLMTSSKVQYVSKGANFRKLGYEYTGSMKVLETILRYDYFWNKIRVQGGAYGAFTQFRRNGNMVFGSYRDPNLAETVSVYDNTESYLSQFTVDEREMTKYIIGTMSSLDTPLTPSQKGEVAAECYMRNIAQADIQRERDEVLATRQHDIRALATVIGDCMRANNLCVFGNEAKIKNEERLFDAVQYVFE